ncbi:hypothetical protein [Candidatus Pantoea multigeneris]|uniref:Uncharacterized protein n=1 Tax=Candidatus Pantoea multigeneris TaxID=2608357 RepID=A0ABX0RD68_9GAMM|nr:hypothetical protein [Pantoea multigeneris]NIF23288.1 hypothetical protein [Pantoea multigeneris]
MLFELRVLSGLNMGAAFPLTKKRHIISNDVNADIYIKISGDEKSSFALDKQNEGWVLDDPVSGRKELIYNDKAFKIKGDHYVIKLTTDDWCDKSTSSGSRVVYFRSVRSVFIIFNIVLFAVFLIFTAQGGKNNDVENAYSGEVSLVDGVVSEQEEVVWLRKILRDYDLHKNVKVIQNTDGFIIEGELLLEQGDRKNKAVKLYQDKLKKKIHDKTNLSEVSTTPFDIKQIVSSNPAHLVTVDNDYIFVGDELDGWRLKSVNMTTVEFEKVN